MNILTNIETKNSIIIENINNGLKNEIISLNEDQSKITYHCKRDYTTTFKNPEEKVRASYFTELILEYKYPVKQIDIEVTVPRRTPEDRADIIIYDDLECKNPYLVVECKKEGITDAEFKQAIEQAFGNANGIRAKYASVVAGNTKTAFDISGFKPSEREKNVIADIPVKFGKAPKYRFKKGDGNNELKIVSREELISALEKCHDTVWQGGKLAPTTAFDEVSKLLFCKMKDEKDGTKKGKHYSFQIGTYETSDEVYKRVETIYNEAKKQDAEVFKEDIRLEPKVVYSVVEHLQGLALNKTDLDTKGVAFERFMTEYFKGKMGQFFTPRQVIDFAVNMMQPEFKDRVIDPSCGSGGFLLAAMDKVRKDAESDYDEREAYDIWHNFAKKNLFGIEINDQIARVCKMNMIIHDDGHTNVISKDSLDFFKKLISHHKEFKPNSFDLLLANPPFGAQVKKTEKELGYLKQYDLGITNGKERPAQKTEILFIERCIEFLKDGTGRMAIVLPDGILTNSSLQYVRNLILEKCEILSIISFPQFTFSHFGAGVKSSILFIRKKGKSEKLVDYNIFMAFAEHIGYDASGTQNKKSELSDINIEYFSFQENKASYEVPKEWNEKIFITKRSEIDTRLDVENQFKKMFSTELTFDKYKTKKLGEIAELKRGPFGGSIKKEIFVEQGENTYQVYEQYNAINNDTERARYFLSEKDFKRLEGFAVESGDLLMSCSGTIGKITVIPDDFQAGVINQALLRIRLTEDINREYFVLIFSFIIDKLLEGNEFAYGAAIKNIVSVKELKEIDIPIPPIKKQNEIAQNYKAKIAAADKLMLKSQSMVEDAKNELETIFIG